MTPCIRYFKRFRMELDLRRALPLIEPLPDGYRAVAWRDELLAAHARTKFDCFVGELDTHVFQSLATHDGCRQLMKAISDRPGFVPGATWLIAYGDEFVGTVQGVRIASGVGAIQNLGVAPGHRGFGLGRHLMVRALHGFFAAKLPGALLEVTAENVPAVALYRQLGFRCKKTVYKAVEMHDAYALVAEPAISR